MLALLYALEFSTNISRRAGYTIGNPAAGLFFQNALSIFSRLIMFVFMPLVGFLSDTDKLTVGSGIFYFLLIPFTVFICYKNKKKIEIIYGNIILRLHENGSYLKKAKQTYRYCSSGKKELKRNFKLLVVVINLPFYISWATVLLLLVKYNQYRATVISLAALLNGIYTLSVNLLVDPYLSKMGNYKNIILTIYDKIMRVKLISAIVSSIIIFIIYVFIIKP